MAQRILCASNNPGKLQELQVMVQAIPGLTVVAPADLGIDMNVDETGASFAENAILKAEAFLAAAGGIVLADDSGLVVDALGGAPGVYSARYGGPGAEDEDRNRLVLEQLIGVPYERRTARFVCLIAVAAEGRRAQLFEGTVEGFIAEEPRGEAGFGYDSIFYFPPLGCTFGELNRERKSAVSHRGDALRAATPYLRQLAAADILEIDGGGSQSA